MRIVVIGGGIAGPAAALALAAAGVDVSVHEARPDGGRDRGAFLTVMPDGIDALRSLDVEAAARARGIDAGGIEVVDADGAPIRESVFDRPGHVPFTITRSDLAAALREECGRRGVPVAYGSALQGLHEAADGVVVRFADGTSEPADVVVGADGIRSRTRTLLNPAAPEPRPLGLTVVYGFDAVLDDPPPPRTIRFCAGREAFFGYKVGPGGGGWWFARLATAPADRERQPAAYWRERVLAAVRGDGGPVARVVEGTGEQVLGIVAHDLVGDEHASTPVWHDDRVVLLGDAAHAADPADAHGATAALADALCLAEELTTRPTVEEAFRAYEAERRPLMEEAALRAASSMRS